MQVEALACELPSTHGVPLSRWSRAELARYVQETGLGRPADVEGIADDPFEPATTLERHVLPQ